MDSNMLAEAICRQVDFYFSDENLSRPDKFLLGKMRGRKNRPVPLSVIHSFARMRDYQPVEVVIDALKASQQVDLVKMDDESWALQRKTAFIMEEVKGYALKQPGTKSKTPKPTGFETFYADAPIHPATFEEERELYSEDLPFSERIQIALQRYQAKRRFHSRNKNIFDKFLKFGGINAGPKQFTGGISPEDLEDKTAAEIAALTSTYYVGDDKEDWYDEEPTWVVDFERVAKAFFSSNFPSLFELASLEIDIATTMIHNFYNYLLHHNVSPTHTAAIDAARKICVAAKAQLHAIRSISSLLPGQYNKACSTYFGGSYKNLAFKGPDEESPGWGKADEKDKDRLRLSSSAAKATIAIGVTAMLPEKSHGPEFWTQTIVSSFETGLEVTNIAMPSDSVRTEYAQFPGREALGVLQTKRWTVPSFAEDDLPAEVILQRAKEASRPLEFWIEETILRECFVGMKLQTTVHILSSGRTFFDTVTAVHCAFFEELPNELLRGWREPKWRSREETLARIQRKLAASMDGGDTNEPDIQVSKVEVGNNEVKVTT